MIFKLNSPLDMHLHLRDENMLKLVAPHSSKTFAAALVMPNLVPPVTTKIQLLEYKKRIQNACKDDKFLPLMSIFYKNYDENFLEDIKDEIFAIKLYPDGVTTNSSGGISNFDINSLSKTLNILSNLQIPLCIHGETNGFVMDRENEFCDIYEKLAISFPKLKIIMEHITTKKAVSLLEKHENLYASITLHHLLITLDDLAGKSLQPHLFCKPIAKRYEDKDALLEVALQGHKKVMFGSDSAPHPKHKKECCGCAAGIYTSPIALQVLCELFEKHNCLENLESFVSLNAQKIHNFSPLEKQIILEKKDFMVPSIYENFDEKVVPFYANEILKWSIKEVI